jgi:predicted ATPase
MNRIESIHIRGFRSLADVEIKALGDVTVLIGPNGSGKSNFVRFFELMSYMLSSRQLGLFVGRKGGADDQLFRGRRVTSHLHLGISIRTDKGSNDYEFSLVWGNPDRFLFTEERFRYSQDGFPTKGEWQELGSGHTEALIVEAAQGEVDGINRTTARVILHLLWNCATYHFHDTSEESDFKEWWDAQDSTYLRSNGGNLAPVLLRLQREDIRRFELITKQVRRILPTFERFDIREIGGRAFLAWKQWDSDKLIGAHLTSDGSLRFFALVTLLNLPPEMLPSVILLDEPELGLHPEAIELVGAMIRRVGLERQVIVATQSPTLVDVFDLDQVIVLDLDDGRTICRQLDPADYQQWLDDDFALSELWWKNVLGGNP